MALDAHAELQVRRYLLASLSEEEREQVETRLLTEEDFLNQIDLVEDELVEEYLVNKLSAADRKRFENVFLSAPERQHKLRFVRALRVRAAEAAKSRDLNEEPWRYRWWKPVLELFNIPRPVLAYSLAAALLVLAAGIPWVFFRMVALKGQVSSLQALQQNSQAVESGLRAEIKKEQEQIASLLRQEQGERPPVQLTAANQPWFTLSSGAQRGVQSTPGCEIPKGADIVWLKLDLAENRKETYKAVVMSGGKEILSRSNLKASVTEKEIAISFRMPAADLPGGDCEVRLFGSDENEPSDIFNFRVIRK
jgi:hypothetical protein